MIKSLRVFLSISVMVVSTNHLYSQVIDTKEISKKHGITKILSHSRLSNNYALHIKNLYALHLKNGTVRIYDYDSDILENKSFTHFIKGFGTYAGISDGKWKIYVEQDGEYTKETYKWLQIGEIDQSNYDAVMIIDFNHFIGSKEDKKELFYFDDKSNSMIGFDEILHATDVYPEAYEKGIFVRLSNQNPKKGSKIAYLDYETGEMKSQFTVDSIISYPTPFIDFCIVKRNKKYFIYSFKDDELIDSSFTKFYVVPIYYYPLILKDEYIGFGDDDWKKLDIKKAISISFIENGDLVNGLVKTEDGKKYNIDLWAKKIVD